MKSGRGGRVKDDKPSKDYTRLFGPNISSPPFTSIYVARRRLADIDDEFLDAGRAMPPPAPPRRDDIPLVSQVACSLVYASFSAAVILMPGRGQAMLLVSARSWPPHSLSWGVVTPRARYTRRAVIGRRALTSSGELGAGRACSPMTRSILARRPKLTAASSRRHRTTDYARCRGREVVGTNRPLRCLLAMAARPADI